MSVDPLANYNPVFETEHYGDGQHNGGIFNDKNLNTYGYCYGNPVVLVDPTGKQTASPMLGGSWMIDRQNSLAPYYSNAPATELKNNPGSQYFIPEDYGGHTDSGGNLHYGDTTLYSSSNGYSVGGKEGFAFDKTDYIDDASEPIRYMVAGSLAFGGGLVYGGVAGLFSGTSDAALQWMFKGEFSQIDWKQSGIQTFVKNPVASFGAGSANNFLNSEIEQKREKDLGYNTLKIGTGGIGTLFNELGPATTPGLKGQILGSIMGNVFSNTTDKVIDISNQNQNNN